MVRCEQVKAHLALGEFDGAAEVFQPVLETAVEHRVGPLVRRVADIASTAQHTSTHTNELRAIFEGATDFIQLPAPDAPRSLS
jgi:hypothetical protein